MAGSTYLWLYLHENLPTRHQDPFNALRAVGLSTGSDLRILRPDPTVMDSLVRAPK